MSILIILTLTKLHQDEYLIHPIRHFVPCSVHKINDIRMSFENPLYEPVKLGAATYWILKRTMMSTSFLTSFSIDSLATAIRFNTWCVVP